MPDDKKPAGGLDETPLQPTNQPTYTLRITFHRATHLPAADISSLSSDPYVLAQINTSLSTRHKEDPKLRFRSSTKRVTMNPVWDEEWIVAGVPEDGMTMKVRVYDEDANDHDDRLGGVHIHLPVIGNVDNGWKDIKEQGFEIKARRASKRVNAVRLLRHILPDKSHAPGDDKDDMLIVSIESLGRTPDDQEVGKVYTVGPCIYRKHFSPMLGRMMGMKDVKDETKAGEVKEGGPGDVKDPEEGGKTQRFDFEANEIQLRGPIPNELYHRFVEFKGFVAGMFNATGIRGKILHKVLHTQHEKIYGYDKQTEYGSFKEPSEEMSLKFLDMVHFDEGGRLFTYVISSDALFRFCETGPEFGIDLLSKHTMHSDVDRYIAWSGEFMIRRLAQAGTESGGTHPSDQIPGGPPNQAPTKDVKHYELIIDNDSGTYRPEKALIPVFQKFLEGNFPGLKIVVMECMDENLKKIKKEQHEAKLKEGKNAAVVEGSDSGSDGGSFSSSDEEDLDQRVEAGKAEGPSAAGGKIGKAVEVLEAPQKAFEKISLGH